MKDIIKTKNRLLDSHLKIKYNNIAYCIKSNINIIKLTDMNILNIASYFVIYSNELISFRRENIINV